MPWSDAANRSFNDDFRFDYKKSDGWELLYNEFRPDGLDAAKFFILYNKYRGIIRFYHYVSSSTHMIAGNDVLMTTLEVDGKSTPTLNFSDQTLSSLTSSLNFFKVEPQKIGDYVWLASQYEIAYDRLMDQYKYYDLEIRHSVASAKLDHVVINNKRSETLPCGVLIRADGKTHLNIQGQNDLMQVSAFGSIQNSDELGDALTEVKPTSLLNGNFAGDSDFTNFMWNANAEIYTTTNALITSPVLPLPGHDQSNTGGLTPFYNRIMGVFYLDEQPKIKMLKVDGGKYPFTYALDANAVKYLFNPAVREIAEFENLKQEIVAERASNSKSISNDNKNMFTGQSLLSTESLKIIGVRVSFDVVPKDGSPTVKIVKTFKANLIED